MNIIRDIRLHRQKPKLSEILRILKTLYKFEEKDIKNMTKEDKEKIISKVKLIFGTSRDYIFMSKFKEDPHNDKLYNVFDRLKKSL